MKYRALLAKLSISLVSTLLTLAAVEVVLRVIKLNPYGMLPRRIDIQVNGGYVPSAYWGTAPLKQPSPFPGLSAGEYVPNIDFRFVYASNPRGYFDSDNAVTSHINRQGIRGPEVSASKADGTFRIVGLGDSFTFGEGVRYEDTFLSRLGMQLNGTGSSEKYEVINCGVSSYNTRDEVVYLEEKWIKLAPDLVLLTFCINDGYDDAEFGPLLQGHVDGATARSDDWNKKPASVLFAWIKSSYERHRIGVAAKEMYLAQFSANPLMRGYAWDDCRQLFARGALLTGANNARLAIIIFPELYQLDERYPFRSIHQQVKDVAAQLGVPVLDLLDSFHGTDAAKLWVHPTDHHPNEIAHKMAAEAVGKFIADPGNRLMEPGSSR